MTKETYLTEQGMLELKEELDNLRNVRRPMIIQSLKDARSLGDLSENAEYDAARTEQAIIEGQITELETLLENAVIVKNVKTDKVSIGVKVKLEFVEDKEIEIYSIVGTKEADPFENKISNESPIAKAIMNKKAGTTVTVECDPSYNVKIVEIF